MSFFDQVYKQLFGQSSPQPKVISNGLIQRSGGYQEKYLEYIQSTEFHELVDSIATSYELKLKYIDQTPQVHLLTSNYANGLAISLEGVVDLTTASYLFDWLRDQVLKLDYQLANSDSILVDKGTFIEMKEKHYLKPHVGNEELLNQRFGNILIEYIKIDDRPNYLKLTANIYSDRKYTKAIEFEKLAEYLFSESLN